MTLQNELTKVEKVATTSIVRCANLNRRNIFIDDEGIAYAVKDDGNVVTFMGGLPQAMDQIHAHMSMFPYSPEKKHEKELHEKWIKEQGY